LKLLQPHPVPRPRPRPFPPLPCCCGSADHIVVVDCMDIVDCIGIVVGIVDNVAVADTKVGGVSGVGPGLGHVAAVLWLLLQFGSCVC
jgi:hypothetical protein